MTEAEARERAEKRDWPEDFAHENGNYMCQCWLCENTFFGYKRRITCKRCAEALLTARADALREAGRGWQPRIGERVESTEFFNNQFGEWRGVVLYVAGIAAEPSYQRPHRLNITVVEEWPPSHKSGRTDGFYTGREDVPDDLQPLPDPPSIDKAEPK